MVTEKRIITPEIAQVLLERNPNRDLDLKHIKFLTNQMISNSFKTETGEAIKISKSGNLLDGQHRLYSLIKANKTYEFLVVSELEDDVFTVLDTGKSRGVRDIVKISGASNSRHVCSAVSYFKDIQENKLSGNKSGRRTAESIINFIRENPDLEEITAWIHQNIHRKIKYIPSGLLAAFYYSLLLKGHTEEKIDNFFVKYSTGLDLQSDDVIYLLREKFIRDSASKIRMNMYTKFYIMIYAWNIYSSDRKVQRLMIPSEMPNIS